MSGPIRYEVESAGLLNHQLRIKTVLSKSLQKKIRLMGNGEEDAVEAAAVARRERLRALKVAQELFNTTEDNSFIGNPQLSGNLHPQENEDDNQEDEEEEASVSVGFRNYLPNDKQLQEGKLAPPVLPKFEDPVLAASLPEEKKEDPFLHIAPKKPNWDLKRDVQKRLDKLEKRTQKAMLILMEREEAKRTAVVDKENEGGMHEIIRSSFT